MQRTLCGLSLSVVLSMLVLFGAGAPPTVLWGAGPQQFTRLELKPGRIVAATDAYPGGRYEATNLVDGDPRSEYSSQGQGIETRIDFDLGQPLPIAGLRHVDRADPATVAKSRLTFSNTPDFGQVLGTVELEHANTRSGLTCRTFPPVTARYVRWQVSELGPKQHGTVGGAELGFYVVGQSEQRPAAQAASRRRSCSAEVRQWPGSALDRHDRLSVCRAD